MSEPSGKPRLSSNTPADPQSAVSPLSGGRFLKSSRILTPKEFRRAYDQGFRYSTRLFAAFCFDTAHAGRATGARVGFTVPRAVGKSVKRNRIKRRMREAFRLDLLSIAPQWDVVINPRRAVLDVPFDEVRREVRKLVSKCKLS